MGFQKATTEGRKLRASIQGPSGSGKTHSALRIAKGIVEREGGEIGVIDAEEGRSRLEAGHFDFHVETLRSFEPGDYVRALRDAAAAGFTVVIVDSISQEWEAILKMKDGLPEKEKFTGWAKLNPKHDEFMRAVTSFPGHIIVTMRSKTKYEIQDVERNGRTVRQPVKLGLDPIARDRTEYEFDLAFELDHESRCGMAKRPRAIFKAFDGWNAKEPGEDVGHMISDALLGLPPPPGATKPTEPDLATKPEEPVPAASRQKLLDAFWALDIGPDQLAEWLGHDVARLTASEVAELKPVYARLDKIPSEQRAAGWVRALAKRLADEAGDETPWAGREPGQEG